MAEATIVAALYHFAPISDVGAVRAQLLSRAEELDLKGTLLVASEGINGTIAGTRTSIDAMLDELRSLPGFADLEHKESTAAEPPFRRLKVRPKSEIVTMGQPLVDPTAAVGRYVDPTEWNELIADPDVVLIDTRNDYEVAIGTFDGAIDPDIERFRDFPSWWEANSDAFEGKKVAMFCTGGIRCEKSTSWLRAAGHDEVYHLKGGILRYLEEIPETDSTWNGECFVFDERVSVGHGLTPGSYEMCAACGRPVGDDDKASPDYEPGVSCQRCIDEHDDERREQFRQRHQQRLQPQ